MIRFYIVPVDLVGEVRTVRYFPSSTVLTWSYKDYGLQLVALVKADTDDTQHAEAISDPEIYAFPDDGQGAPGSGLDTTIPNAPAVRADLEPYGIPLQWITNGLAWRLVVRYTLFLFSFASFLAGQSFRSRYGAWRLNPEWVGAILPPGVTFNTTYDSLPYPYRGALWCAFMSVGWEATRHWNVDGDLPHHGLDTVTLRQLLEELEVYTQTNPFVWDEVTV